MVVQEIKMKKTDAINKVKLLLKMKHGHTVSSDFKQTAKEIVELLEKYGMKPPLTKKCPVLLTTEHHWEPENDTK